MTSATGGRRSWRSPTRVGGRGCLREAAVGFDRVLHTDLSDDEAAELRRLLGKVSPAVSALGDLDL